MMKAANRANADSPKAQDPESFRPANAETASLAAYVADMSAELATLAQRAGLQMLAQFLSLARVEAEIRSRELGGFDIARRPLNAPVSRPKVRSRRRSVAR
jgi:hypothetical protein